MKTAIFFNTLVKMSNYDLDELSKNNINLIAIVAETELSAFQQKYATYFSKIYASPPAENIHTEKLNYAFAKQVVAETLKQSDFVRLICQSEDNLLVAAKLRDEFAIPGMNYQNTLLFRDKVLMKKALQAAGIRVPKFKSFSFPGKQHLPETFANLQAEFGLPFVLKPTNLLGGIGVVMIDSLATLQSIVEFDQPGLDYEVEEFITGTLYHCDAIHHQGKTLFVTCCEDSNPNFDFQLGKSVISLPLNKEDPLTQRLFEFNANVVNALHFTSGVTHHEIFVTEKNEIVFLEIAARSPGALITPMYRQAFNIGFEDSDFKMQMEIPFELKPTYDRHYMSGILPILPGKVEQLIQPTLRSQFEIKFMVKPGDTLLPCKSLRDKAATITAWSDDYQLLQQDFNYLQNFQCIEVSA